MELEDAIAMNKTLERIESAAKGSEESLKRIEHAIDFFAIPLFILLALILWRVW